MNDTNDLLISSLRSLLLIAAITAGNMAAQETAKPGVIRGYVTDNERHPLTDVRLTLRSRGGTTSSQTNASGLFGFTNLPLGSYILTIEAPGYRITTSNGRNLFSTPAGQSLTVEISSTHLNADIAVSLRRTATIEGSVLDSEGKPTYAASVILLRRRSDAIGAPQLVPVLASSVVDATGQYRINGVDEGEYFIRAEHVSERNGTRLSSSTYVRSTNYGYGDPPIVIGSPEWLPPVYYPGTSDIRNAAPIIVGRAATLLTGINIVVNREDRFSISGRIINASEDVSFAVPQIHVVQALNSSDSTTVTNMANDQTKAFEIKKVGAGVYDLVAFVFRDGVSYTGRTQVEVHASAVDDVDIVLKRATDLSGKVVSANPEAGVNLSELRIVLTAVKPTPASSLNTISASALSNGSFELKKIPAAEYVLSVQGLAPDHYVESARLDNEDILNHSFLISSRAPRLNIIVNAPGGEIAGHLISAGGEPLTAVATIVLVPVQRSNNPLNSFKVTRSNDRGEFDLSGIRPGQYHALAFEPVAVSPAYYNEDFLRQYEYRGSPVTIVAGQVIKLDLTPIHARLP